MTNSRDFAALPLTAEYVKAGRGNAHATWQLYKLSRPLEIEKWGETETATYDHVVVSASDVMFSGPETYVFPADAEGEVTDWMELPGSFKGALDFERALNGFLECEGRY